jgi:hypothetical protein
MSLWIVGVRWVNDYVTQNVELKMKRVGIKK